MNKTQHSELEQQIRRALAPDSSTVGRVVGRALQNAKEPRRFTPAYLFAAICGVVAALSLIVLTTRHTAAPAVTIRESGGFVVVERVDGQRVVVGHPPARTAGGNYIILVRD
jgi:hypothetical protein